MQAENLSAWACIFAWSAGLGGCPPFGVYFRHARCAFWKEDESGLTPFNVTLPFAEGSEKLGTPWERMQEANFRIDETSPPTILKLPPLPPPLVPESPDAGGDEAEELVVGEPALATPGRFALLPQPAAAAARPSAASGTATNFSAIMLIIPFGSLAN
ncbi:MAG TPA: hypothetical protein VF002_00830 [Gaiellaceae bacterium]